MKSAIRSVGLLVVIVLMAASSMAKERLFRDKWYLFESPHFSVITNEKDDEGQELIDEI